MKGTLLDKVFTFIEENALFSAPCHLLLGLSGGADSMALLHILTHWPSLNIRVSAVHVHHGLRGKTADADERVFLHNPSGFPFGWIWNYFHRQGYRLGKDDSTKR